MSDRLEEVKGNHEHLFAGEMNPYTGEVILLSPEDYDYLIAEVERLREVEPLIRGVDRRAYEKKFESLTKERDEWKAKCEIDIRIEQCVMTDRKDSPIMHYAIKPRQQDDPIVFKTIQKIRLIGYRILPLEDFKKLESENSALKTKTEFDWAHRQKVEAENAELKKQNKSVEYDWAHCAEGWSKCQLDLKCLEESTVDKKAWDQKVDQMIDLKEKLAASEKARRIKKLWNIAIKCNLCGAIFPDKHTGPCAL